MGGHRNGTAAGLPRPSQRPKASSAGVLQACADRAHAACALAGECSQVGRQRCAAGVDAEAHDMQFAPAPLRREFAARHETQAVRGRGLCRGCAAGHGVVVGERPELHLPLCGQRCEFDGRESPVGAVAVRVQVDALVHGHAPDQAGSSNARQSRVSSAQHRNEGLISVSRAL
jgi:hypothetical protein